MSFKNYSAVVINCDEEWCKDVNGMEGFICEERLHHDDNSEEYIVVIDTDKFCFNQDDLIATGKMKPGVIPKFNSGDVVRINTKNKKYVERNGMEGPILKVEFYSQDEFTYKIDLPGVFDEEYPSDNYEFSSLEIEEEHLEPTGKTKDMRYFYDGSRLLIDENGNVVAGIINEDGEIEIIDDEPDEG